MLVLRNSRGKERSLRSFPEMRIIIDSIGDSLYAPKELFNITDLRGGDWVEALSVPKENGFVSTSAPAECCIVRLVFDPVGHYWKESGFVDTDRCLKWA